MLIICGSPSENKARALGQMIATARKKDFRTKTQEANAARKLWSFGNYVMKFSGEKNKNAWICSDKEVYRAYTDIQGYFVVLPLQMMHTLHFLTL